MFTLSGISFNFDLCAYSHLNKFRNIEKLAEELSPEDISRLKGFRGLMTAQEIEDWQAFCEAFTTPKAKGELYSSC